jgi:tight adherence protein B
VFLVLALVFGATMLLVIATYRFTNRRHLAGVDALRERLTPIVPTVASTVRILKEQRASQLEFLNRLLSGKPLTAFITKELARADSSQTPGGFFLTSGLTACIGWFIGNRAGVPVGIVIAAFGAAVPFVYLRWRQGQRIKAFEAQLPDAIDMLVNAMKAGYSLQAAMKFIGDEIVPPLGPIFARFYDEQRLGVDVRVALQGLQERIDTLDVRMFVTALLIQRETGGNLAEIMTSLSTVMRERVSMRGQINTMTAEPKLSAIVLALLPVVLFFLFNMLNHDYMQSLYTTPPGRMMLVYAVVSTTIGYMILRKLGDIDI